MRKLIKNRILFNVLIYFVLVTSCKKDLEVEVIRNNYEVALEKAEKENKKLFIYFDVISLPKPYLEEFLKNRKLRQILANDYIVVRLQCDKGIRFGGDTIDLGSKNINIERKLTGQNYQPLYYIKDKKVEKFIGYSTLEELIEFVE